MSRRRKKKKSNKGLPMIALIVVAVCISLGVYTHNLKKQNEKLILRQQALEQQIESEEQRTKDLEALEKYMQTKKYMEEVAKEKLGLVYPDEILIEPSNK